MDAARWIAERIKEAREGEGLTQNELADRLGLTQTAVSYWEAGKRTPGFDDLYDLADALDRDVGYFMPRRSREPVRAVLRAQIERLQLANLEEQLEALLDKAERAPAPTAELSIRAARPVAAAQELLSKTKVLKPPVDIEHLATLCGLRVLKMKFQQALSGLLVDLEDAPLIGVNSSQHEHRQRFTVAHELGHHLLGHHDRFHIDLGWPSADGDPPNMNWHDEREANEFAANALMPAAWVRQRAQKETSVAALANVFGVSPIAMGYRLTALGLR